jgi:hypothetical protein
MTVGRWRSILVRAGALLALALLGWSAPAGARAGCGDYVVLDAHGALTAPAIHDSPAVAPEPRPVPAPHPAPCHGPLCSRNSMPPWNAVPPSPAPIEQWGQVGSVLLFADRGGLRCCYGSPIGRPQHHPAVIYHPPRTSPAFVTL